jgi:hypothetical protein
MLTGVIFILVVGVSLILAKGGKFVWFEGAIRIGFSKESIFTKINFRIRTVFTCRNHANAPAITGKATRVFRRVEAFVLSDKCQTLDDIRNWDKDESVVNLVIDFMKDSLRKRNPSVFYIRHLPSFECRGIILRKKFQFVKVYRLIIQLPYFPLYSLAGRCFYRNQWQA